MKKTFSIVVPTYNQKNTLKKCLGALFTQSYPKDKYEIIVVDGGSTDGTEALVTELIDKKLYRLQYLKQKPKGRAVAKNVGVKNADGEIILFTGDDCIADSHLLQEHMKYHNTYKKDVAVLGYTAWYPALKVTPFMDYIVQSGVQFGYPLIKDKENVSFCFFYTSNISVKRKHLINVGLFDEDFEYYGYEDTELGYRLSQKGIKIVYNEAAITYHYHPTTLREYCERQKEVGKSAVVFYKKHPELREFLGISASTIKNFKMKLILMFFKVLNRLNGTKFRDTLYHLILSYNYMIGVKEGLTESIIQ